jgi:hypothetical protein
VCILLIAEYTFDRLIEPRDRARSTRGYSQRLEEDVKEALAGRGVAVLASGSPSSPRATNG